ncbi:hypothetical protein [Flavobacterium cerinum]|uniref:Uncharacterized protein n=1 Tax=Flavobacterium cerinum TaxID=2502784 RepID=A0ABY5IPI7_9FLAO|nr:hypothetical protein [Flavobacterium cerinum]UUC44746.1 hypothetical protein NOX80_14045 [Flavobacterium cerinum]
MDICIICNYQLEEKQIIRRARMRDKDGKPQADRITYKARCPSCEIYLRKQDHGKTEGHWGISNIKESDLKFELSENEFLTLKSTVEKKLEKISDDYRFEREKWAEFITIKKQNDKIYAFSQCEGDYIINGYVIKRDNYFISEYTDEIKKNG